MQNKNDDHQGINGFFHLLSFDSRDVFNRGRAQQSIIILQIQRLCEVFIISSGWLCADCNFVSLLLDTQTY